MRVFVSRTPLNSRDKQRLGAWWAVRQNDDGSADFTTTDTREEARQAAREYRANPQQKPLTDAEALALVLREQGLDTGGASPHSWRCEHPDRYPGFCTCVEDMVQAILDGGFHRG